MAASDAPGIAAGDLVDHDTKEDYVADFLREGIITGRFARGAKLRQAEVASLTGTSITPVREALKLLEAEGFVVGTSHRGAIVAYFDAGAAQEIVDLRVLLENRLAIAAMQKITSPDIANLQALQRDFEAAAARSDKIAARSINYRFHESIYVLASLPQTLRFVRILWARYPFDLINQLPGRIDRASREHHGILTALLAGDPAQLMNALSAHIRSGWEEYRQDPPPAPAA